MTMTFSKMTRRMEFEKDLKKLLKRYPSLQEDLVSFEKTQLELYHKQKKDNGGIVRINDLAIANPPIFKALKFACKSLKGRGAASGIRVIYAYFEESDHIELIQIYFKADEANEDKERIKSIYGRPQKEALAFV